MKKKESEIITNQMGIFVAKQEVSIWRAKERGITLIALVITVIVLLILAGVAISMTLNEGNIFEKANEAKTSWNAKAAEEEDAIWNALSEIGMERPVQRDGDNPTAPTSIAFTDGKVVATGGTDASSNVAGYEYSLDQVTWTRTMPELTGYTIGEEFIGETPKWGTVANTIIETSEVKGVTKTRKAPVPTGYTASSYSVTGFVENTIEKGLVIYEGTDAVNTSNHDTAMTNRNQYVWIPVDDINDMIMCTGSNIAQTVTVYVRTVDTTGNVSEATSQEIALTAAQSQCNIVFDKTGNLVCSTHMAVPENTHFLCGRLYGSDSSFGTQNPTTYKYNSDWREPAVVTNKSNARSLDNYLDNQGTGNYDCDPANSILKEDGTTSVTGASNILTELKRQFNNMAKSVAVYGGFYVGRYEAGYVDNAVISRKGTIVNNILTPLTINASYPARVGSWYGLYNKLIEAKTGTVSQMIWGCQWDQVMKFVNGKTDGNGDPYNVTEAKTTSGKTRHTGSKAATGANINDLVQNIYDLEGNYWEWTSEAYSTYNRARRGGYDVISSNYPASASGYNNPTDVSSSSSARAGLYVSL